MIWNFGLILHIVYITLRTIAVFKGNLYVAKQIFAVLNYHPDFYGELWRVWLRSGGKVFKHFEPGSIWEVGIIDGIPWTTNKCFDINIFLCLY